MRFFVTFEQKNVILQDSQNAFFQQELTRILVRISQEF